MTPFTILLAIALPIALLLLVTALARLIDGDGDRDLFGRARRHTASSLPRSHHDPFEPGAWGRTHR